MPLKWPVLALLTVLLPVIAFTQPGYQLESWDALETNIRLKKNLVATNNQLEDIKAYGHRKTDYNIYARARYCQLQIADIKTEDSLYFQNSAFIDSILLDPQTPAALQLPMHVMQARRLSVFNARSGYGRAKYYKSAGSYNYASYTEAALDSIIRNHYKQARELAAGLNNAAPEDYCWLSSNPLTFLFKPTLNDIILAEHVGYYATIGRFDNMWEKRLIQWLQLSPVDFVNALDTIRSNNSNLAALRLYSEWLTLHRKDTATFFFIETLARKYVYENLRSQKNTEAAYEKYLQNRTESPIKEVKAHAVYQLCLLWNSRVRTYRFLRNKWPPVKALQLYESNRSVFDDYAYLGRVLEAMKQQILSSEIQWMGDKVAIPGEPVMVRITYSNTTSLHYRIIPVRQSENINYRRDSTIIKDLVTRSYLKSVTESLPATDDLDKHNVLLKIDALPAGKYWVLFSPKEITGYEKAVAVATLEVSQIAIIPSDDRVYVLNRKNGLPLPGAHVSIEYDESDITTSHVIGKEGYVRITKKEGYHAKVTRGNDTAGKHSYTDDVIDELYDKESEDLVEYYANNARIHILTDRSIYRPGQTVFYKGIVMTKHPYTGEDIILNKKNLQQGLFRNFLKKWLAEEEPVIYVRDPFYRETDTIRIKPNAYGSISGSFRIPATAATGDWKIDSDLEYFSYGAGAFSVEEYKRPTYELIAEPIVRSNLPGDTVSFRLKARSFSGGSMANTKITYTIDRKTQYGLEDGTLEALHVDSIVLTGENGTAEIKITDAPLRNTSLPDSVKWDFRYELNATAVDLSGESQIAKGSFLASNRPVSIKIPVIDKYFVSDFKPVLITATNFNKMNLAKEIKVKVFREKPGQVNPLRGITYFPDQWKYTKEQLTAWFPYIIFTPGVWEKPELVYETTIKTGTGEKLRIPANIATPGEYSITAACYENNILRGKAEQKFTLYDTVSLHIPGSGTSFFHVPYRDVYAGDSVLVYAGSAFDSTCLYLQFKYYSRHNKKLHVVSVYRQQMVTAGVHLFKFRLPEDATGRASVSSFFIRNNVVYKDNEDLIVNRRSDEPAIIIEKFRNKLTPGQQTTFSVSVRTRDHKVVAELMSTMYDASLDRLEKHTWELPALNRLRELRNEWPRYFNDPVSEKLYFNKYTPVATENKPPIWWMPHSYYQSDLRWQLDDDYDVMGDHLPMLSLQGRVAGIDISQATGFNEIVIGYGTPRMRNSTGSIVRIDNVSIRGMNSIPKNDNQLVVLDGVPYNGSLSGVNVAEITEVIILKGADATAIYGARAANGVILISTKGPVKLPVIAQEPVVKVRSNFNELAFFQPAVYADRDGYYRFTFTVPESLTEWNWKLFAHTKNAQFAYAEKKLTTQLPFMIQPNMPKQVYQGDRLVLKTRISNLDSLSRSGKTICKVEDVVTGEDISAVVLKNKETGFDVAAQSNTVTGFVLNIPAGQLNPLKITIKATAGEFSDGEEHIIPVMTEKILVQQAVAVSLVNHTDTLIALPALKETYGVSVNIQPKPQSALINSLPFLANYSFDCAEQTFNKMWANLTALDLMRTDKALNRLYETTKQAAEKAAAPPLLPNHLSEQQMPWLHLSAHAGLQQKQLAELFDTARAKSVIIKYRDKLITLQNKDGGLSWFEGGGSDAYITAYVLAGLGKLALNTRNKTFMNEQRMQNFIGSLIKYIDGDKEHNTIYNAYARGYWKAAYPVSENQTVHMQDIIKQQWKQIDELGLHQQALLIIATRQWFDVSNAVYEKAMQQLENIREQAITDPVNGIRWKTLADANDMSTAAEETLALLAEAFDKTPNTTAIDNGIIKWLLSSKADYQWRSTKAAAATISVLQQTADSLKSLSYKLSTDINGLTVSVTDDLLRGNPFSFVKTSKVPETVTIKKTGDGAVHGNIVAYHFEPASQLSQYNTDIQLAKKLLRYNTDNKYWEPVLEGDVLKVSEKVKVILTIKTARNLPYVHLDDKSSGAFEAGDQRSGYQYENSISYYRSVRDGGMQFFATLVPAGRTEISYELTVAQEGSFTNGPASLQCMYKPEKAAYSNSILINTKE